MPGHLIPHKSGVHRTACFALYRALLRQKFELLVPEQRRQYESQVKSKTRENARLQGHWDIHLALRLGYETLEAVRDETRRPAILSRIAELSAPPLRCFPRHDKKTSAKAPKTKLPRRTTPTPRIDQQPRLNSPVLERPYPKISGRRHVPKLINANRFPFLRIKKPQSKLLSALIRYSIRSREKRLLRSSQLEKLTQIGKDEDEWDDILKSEFDVVESGSSWRAESIQAHNEIKRQHGAALEKRKRIAREMTIIVEKEKALAQEESVELRKRQSAQSRIKHLIRHGREEEAKELAKETGIGAPDLEALIRSKESKEGATEISEPQAETTTTSKNSEIISEIPTEPAAETTEDLPIDREDPMIAQETDTARVKAEPTRSRAEREVPVTAARRDLADVEWLQYIAEKQQKLAATRRTSDESGASFHKHSDSDPDLAASQPPVVARKITSVGIPRNVEIISEKAVDEEAKVEEATKIELAGLGAELPLRNLGQMSLAEAIGDVGNRPRR